ncbi:MAG: hypothetical protein K2X00_15720, partial [Nitrospiraceae bacterium]|nr:hypothetical protein [Nitrospiraceae bacterium]
NLSGDQTERYIWSPDVRSNLERQSNRTVLRIFDSGNVLKDTIEYDLLGNLISETDPEAVERFAYSWATRLAPGSTQIVLDGPADVDSGTGRPINQQGSDRGDSIISRYLTAQEPLRPDFRFFDPFSVKDGADNEIGKLKPFNVTNINPPTTGLIFEPKKGTTLRDAVSSLNKTYGLNGNNQIDHFNFFQASRYYFLNPAEKLPDRMNHWLKNSKGVLHQIEAGKWYADPGYGGDYDRQGKLVEWADNLPWYFDESTPPAAVLQANPNVTGIPLSDSLQDGNVALTDRPQHPPGYGVVFSTYLIPVTKSGQWAYSGNDTSKRIFLGSFDWGVKVSLVKNERKYEVDPPAVGAGLDRIRLLFISNSIENAGFPGAFKF